MDTSHIQKRIAKLTERIKEAESEHEILRLRHEQDKLLDRILVKVPSHL